MVLNILDRMGVTGGKYIQYPDNICVRPRTYLQGSTPPPTGQTEDPGRKHSPHDRTQGDPVGGAQADQKPAGRARARERQWYGTEPANLEEAEVQKEKAARRLPDGTRLEPGTIRPARSRDADLDNPEDAKGQPQGGRGRQGRREGIGKGGDLFAQ